MSQVPETIGFSWSCASFSLEPHAFAIGDASAFSLNAAQPFPGALTMQPTLRNLSAIALGYFVESGIPGPLSEMIIN